MMSKNIKLQALLIILLIPFAFLKGQNEPIYQDVIQLKSGYTFKCSIIYVDQNGMLYNTSTKDSIFLSHDMIKFSKQANEIDIPKQNKVSQIKNRWIGSLQVGLGSGGPSEAIFSAFFLDAGLKYQLSERYNRHYIRTNVGLQNYNGFYNVQTLSWTGGYQFVLLPKNVSPYIYGDVGTGIGLGSAEQQFQTSVEKVRGGNTWGLGLGLLISQQNFRAVDFSLGYVFQKANLKFENTWQTNTVDQEFKRIVMKIGVNF
jgi:hypothetical protein